MLNIFCKPHRTSLRANTSEPQKLFVMLQLIPKPEVAKARPPVALALALDTSSSMREFADQKQATEAIEKQGLQGQQQRTEDGSYQAFDLSLPTKLDEAIRAAHDLIDDSRLVPEDKITIIHFDDNGETLLPLTALSEKAAAHQAVDSLKEYYGGTYMGEGMSAAQQQLNSLPSQVVKRLLLLTDGQTFDEPDCQSLAPEFAKVNTPLITIGIGEEYNEKLLLELASASQGRPYHLDSDNPLPKILNDELDSSVREVITDLQVTVPTVKGITLSRLIRVYPSLSEVSLSGTRYQLGNIPSGDYTVFVLEFTISGVKRPPSRCRIAQVGLAGHAPGLGRKEEFAVQEIFVNFTTDEAALAAVDADVLGYVQQINVDRNVQDAMEQMATDPNRARQTLQIATNMTKRLGNTAVTQMLENALDELNQKGTISANTVKTVRAGGRTRTMKTGATKALDGGLSLDEIRRLTGA